MNNQVVEIGYLSLNHFGEELCGDCVEVVSMDDNSHVVVLADGLGSGVKANILSTLTSQIIATMMANNMSLEECIKAIAETLPVCETRHIAYSTFTVLKINKDSVDIYNYDNPSPFMLRNGQDFSLDTSSLFIEGKKIIHNHVTIQLNDTFFLLSDGTIHAGIGEKMNFGWERTQIIDYMSGLYSPFYSSKSLATLLVDHCRVLYGDKPGDDTTAVVIRVRERKVVNLLIGPATNKEDDTKMLSLFFAKEGKHIVCGGTTSNIVANYLHETLELSTDYIDKDIPPTSSIKGVDIVSEGVITMNKVLKNAKDQLQQNKEYFTWCYKEDGASKITRLLLEEATDINFFVGCAINPAHQKEGLTINFSLKMQLIDELTKTLKRLGKKIKVSYF